MFQTWLRLKFHFYLSLKEGIHVQTKHWFNHSPKQTSFFNFLLTEEVINWKRNLPWKSLWKVLYIISILFGFYKEMVTTKICGLRAPMDQNEELEVKAPDILTPLIFLCINSIKEGRVWQKESDKCCKKLVWLGWT